jgi:hypothetical protein
MTKKDLLESSAKKMLKAKTEEEKHSILVKIEPNILHYLFWYIDKDQVDVLAEYVSKYSYINSIESKCEIIDVLAERGMAEKIYDFYEIVEKTNEKTPNEIFEKYYTADFKDLMTMEYLMVDKCPPEILMKLSVRLVTIGHSRIQSRIYERIEEAEKIPKLARVIEKITRHEADKSAYEEYMNKAEGGTAKRYEEIYEEAEKINMGGFIDLYNKKMLANAGSIKTISVTTLPNEVEERNDKFIELINREAIKVYKGNAKREYDRLESDSSLVKSKYRSKIDVLLNKDEPISFDSKIRILKEVKKNRVITVADAYVKLSREMQAHTEKEWAEIEKLVISTVRRKDFPKILPMLVSVSNSEIRNIIYDRVINLSKSMREEHGEFVTGLDVLAACKYAEKVTGNEYFQEAKAKMVSYEKYEVDEIEKRYIKVEIKNINIFKDNYENNLLRFAKDGESIEDIKDKFKKIELDIELDSEEVIMETSKKDVIVEFNDKSKNDELTKEG